MRRRTIRKAVTTAVVALATAVIPACQSTDPAGAGGQAPRGQEAIAEAAVKELVAEYHGRVLVLLLGREDCPGTAKATAVLDAYALRKPARVEILRLEVPLPGEDLKVTAWNHPFPRRLDKSRLVADQLDFFYYPTVYVFDPSGELRFAGGCDAERLETMADEILAERPGQPKKVYTLPLLPIGSPAPPFAGKTLAGETATLASLAGGRGTVLLFSRTGCPFSMQALPAVRSIADQCRKAGVAVVIINQGEDVGRIRPVYEKLVPGLPVIWDAAGDIGKSYGVDTTPFFFLLKSDGTIAQRRSFTPAAATGALNALLGVAAETPRYRTTKAG